MTEPMHASPQFWESHPATREYPNRVYFTAEGDGRVIAGGSGTGAILTADQVVSLAAWLMRVGGVEQGRKRHTLTDEDWAA